MLNRCLGHCHVILDARTLRHAVRDVGRVQSHRRRPVVGALADENRPPKERR